MHEFGDSYGAFTALVTALTLAALVATLLMQGTELRLQREQLTLQRETLEKQTDATLRLVKLSETQTLRDLASEFPAFISNGNVSVNLPRLIWSLEQLKGMLSGCSTS